MKVVWKGLCTFEMGSSPGSQELALALAWPLIYHSLKLSYLLPYLLPASSLWNASSVRAGTLPPLRSALDQDQSQARTTNAERLLNE